MIGVNDSCNTRSQLRFYDTEQRLTNFRKFCLEKYAIARSPEMKHMTNLFEPLTNNQLPSAAWPA
jgi:hypothetical protein